MPQVIAKGRNRGTLGRTEMMEMAVTMYVPMAVTMYVPVAVETERSRLLETWRWTCVTGDGLEARGSQRYDFSGMVKEAE